MKPRTLIPVLMTINLFCTLGQSAETKIDVVPYGGWQQNLRLTNGTVELVITTEVGPRILRYGFVGEENVFWENTPQLGGSGEPDFRVRGGHRLWTAPEQMPRTYYPDNAPVSYEKLSADSVRVRSATEQGVQVIKELDVSLAPDTGEVTVLHRILNAGPWPIELAPWALTTMAPGGIEIIPLPMKRPHPEQLLPQFPLVMWSYTDMTDSRFTWGARYIGVKQDTTKGPTKIGLTHMMGWSAYIRNGYLFVKSVPYQAGATYPDMGSNYETWTNQEMLEMETLGPLQTLEPGKTCLHIERWRIYKDVPELKSEADVDNVILPRLRG